MNVSGSYSWYNGSYWRWWSEQTYYNYTTAKNCLSEDIKTQEAGPFLIQGENVTVSLHFSR